MFPREPIFHSGDPEKIWQKFCGFLDLSLKEFMEIQEELLMEQIELVAGSPLGKKIMNGHKPKSIKEFRQQVPLTTYEDYAPYIGEQQEDSMAAKAEIWAHTSGRGGKFKWVPYTERGLERQADCILADLILATAEKRGDVRIREGSRFLFILAPRPYFSGIASWIFAERYGLKVIPPPALSEQLTFQDRIKTGFQMAMRDGMDSVGAVATVLIKVGESFSQSSQGMKLSPALLHPKIIFRLLRGYLRSKAAGRAMLPKDLWSVKGLSCGGTDASIYKKKLEYFWGKTPHEIYGITETGVVAMQSWLKQGLIFYPYLDFFEFIPEAEWRKSKENKAYKPATVLMDELEVGKIYEIVATNFYGMPFLRYRPGDLIKITSLEEEGSGIKIPQFTFHARGDDLINLYSIVMLDERTIWEALNNTNVSYEDWSVRKEIQKDIPVLSFYLEPKQATQANVLERLLNEQLQTISPLYKEAIGEVETNPVKVTLLGAGSFQQYYEKMQAAGVDLAHLKPPHMSASDTVIQGLLQCSEDKIAEGAGEH